MNRQCVLTIVLQQRLGVEPPSLKGKHSLTRIKASDCTASKQQPQQAQQAQHGSHLGKGVGGRQHLKATENCCPLGYVLGVCLGVGMEGLPRHGGSGPGVPRGGAGILLPVASPEHALSHIPAEVTNKPTSLRVLHEVR